MTSQSQWSRTIGLIIMNALLLVSCAKESKLATAPGTTAAGTTSTTAVLSSTANVDLRLDSASAFATYSTYYDFYSPYAQIFPKTSNPTNMKLGVSLVSDQGAGNYSGRYSGKVVIAYNWVDSAGVTQYQESVFENFHQQNPEIYKAYDNGTFMDEYNRFFTFGGSRAFTGFFGDYYGAIVLVVGGSAITDAGVDTGNLYGSVYFRNFGRSLALNPSTRKCWFIYADPYSCNSSVVKNKSGLVPDGYIKLGTFINLPKSSAFK